MNKKLLTAILIGLFMLSFASCKQKEDNNILKAGSYVLEDTTSELTALPSITIEGDQFVFSYDLLSSYLSIGSYKRENDTVTMTTDDNKNTYVFKVDGDTLIFQKSQSSDVVLTHEELGVAINDQSKFKRQD